MGNSAPCGWFIGRPANSADEQTQAAGNTQTSQDFLVGTPESLRPQAARTTTATEQQQTAGELRRSRSFMEFKSSGSTEENMVQLRSCTGVNAHNMENKRNRRNENPRKLSFELIKLITNDFSEELGRGAFGQVFMGVLENGEEVAVKMLRFMPNINDQQFENEFQILKRLNHPYIVRLVGFCDEAEEELAEYKGNLIVCLRIHRALCLEYMANGSLGKLLSGENLRPDWVERYKIIKRICEGLKYLHEGLEFPVLHLDLKPDNILLDSHMIAKISDFGLSRLIGDENSKQTLTPLAGTIGYMPPEFIDDQVISKDYDIYSLGVIITEIVTRGISGCSNIADMAAEESAQHVYDNWIKCLQEVPGGSALSLEKDCEQVIRSMEIARTCMEDDRHKRPTITDIVSQLPKETVFYKMVAGPKSSRVPRREPVRSKKQISATNMHKDPPLEICHSTHPDHKLKLMTAAFVPFLCDGCKEPGYGPRYTCDRSSEGHTFDLHTRCALAGDPLFGLHTLVHPLFGYGKKLEFCFLHEAPSSSAIQEEGRRVCDACGEPTRGFVYHCSGQNVDIHPCCASLPDRIIHDGRAFDLQRRASRPCALCPDGESQRRWFWAYRCNSDGEAIDLHVACLKETARRSWEANNRNQDDVGVGDGALNVDSMLENKFGQIAGTIASFITALVFGKLIVNM